jgi:glycosyltransferase involved in cell wall biosynthesis
MRLPLESLVRELKLSEQVEFMGECENVPELLGSSGFYVSSSLSEGISLTILEAMAVGLPVIATNVGGNPEIVVESETGMLVEVGNPERLANAMVLMCQRKSSWETMGQKGRKRVTDFFDVRMMANNYQSLYQDLLRQSSR